MEKKQLILLIDDDEIHLEIAKNILKSKYEIITAKSGKNALEVLIKGTTPNLILLDILMPNMDGWETFNRIRGISLLKDVPIVFLTSLNEKAEKERAREMGASDFITKPFQTDDMLKRIEIAINKQGKKNC